MKTTDTARKPLNWKIKPYLLMANKAGTQLEGSNEPLAHPPKPLL